MSYEKTREYRDIKRGLIARLESNGTAEALYLSLVDTYMRCWVEAKLLEDDVKARGVVVKYITSNGFPGAKKNESIGEKLKVVAQMTKLLDAMGIEPIGQNKGDECEM